MGQWRTPYTGLQKFPRVATTVRVRITTVDPETDPDTGATFFRSADETTANLSRGGAYVASWEPLAAGRRVVVTIDVPEQGELQLVGRVAWTRRQLRPEPGCSIETPGYGIEFTGGSTAELAALDRFLTGIAPRVAPEKQASSRPAPQP